MRPRRTRAVLAGLVALTSILADTTCYGADAGAVPEITVRDVGGAGVGNEGFIQQQIGRRVQFALAGVDDGVGATATTSTVENNKFGVGNVAVATEVGQNGNNNNNDKLLMEGGGEVQHQVRQNVVSGLASRSTKRSSAQQGSNVGLESADPARSTSGTHSVVLVAGEASATEKPDERVGGAGGAAAIAAAAAVGLLATVVGSMVGSSSSAEERERGGDIDFGPAASYGTGGVFEPGREASGELAWDSQVSLREEAARAKRAEAAAAAAAAARGRGLRGRGVGDESERDLDGRAYVESRGPDRRVLQGVTVTPAPAAVVATTPAPEEAVAATPVPADAAIETPAPAPVASEDDVAATPSPVANGTPAPVANETPAPSADATSAPQTDSTTDRPSSLAPSTSLAPTGTLAPGETLAPSETFTTAPGATPSPGAVPTPTGETAFPTVSADNPAATSSPGATLSPGSTTAPTLVPGATLAPTTAPGTTPAPTLAAGATLGPTLAPDATLAPTVAPGATTAPTLAPGATFAPSNLSLSPAGVLNTSSPSFTPPPTITDLLNGTAAPTQTPTEAFNATKTEEALDTTGEVVSSAVAVAVASTAAAVTVTTVSATTAATTAVASTTVTTATTVATAAGTTGGTGGAGGASGASGAGASSGAATTSVSAANATNATATGVHGGGTGFVDTQGIQSGMNNARSSNVASNTGGRDTMQAATMTGTDPSSISNRSPSSALGLMMIFHMQTVSLFRLLEANVTEPFMNFLDSLKWLNLHFDVDLNFGSCDEEDYRYEWTNTDNGTFALNTFFVFGFLAILITFHILMLSYMEAAWLSQANAIHRHRLQLVREQSAIDGNSAAAYAKYLDLQNADRELDEQERVSTERYLKRHNSVWMYFPHVELLFLLFAYQGASAAEARMIDSGCFPLVVLGLCALVVFPVLMMLYVTRVVWSRVRPSYAPVIFRPELSNQRSGCCVSKCCRGICEAWKNGESMFSWADKGKWTSKNDENVDLDSRKFRIGFEPLFVDYTQKGAVYVSFVLFEWFAFGLIAGFVRNGTYQTSAVFLIYCVDILILICFKPFSNSFIQGMQTLTTLADAASLGLMTWASLLDPDDSDDSDRLELIYAGVLVIQTFAIVFLIIPIYLDAFILITSSICRKTVSVIRGSVQDKVKPPIRGSCGDTAWIFCALVRENFIGCVKSTIKGPTYTSVSAVDQMHRRDSIMRRDSIRRESARQLTRVREVDEEEEGEVDIGEYGKLPKSVRSSKDPAARRQVDTSRSALVEVDSGHGPSSTTAPFADGSSRVRVSSARSRASSQSRGSSDQERGGGSGVQRRVQPVDDGRRYNDNDDDSEFAGPDYPRYSPSSNGRGPDGARSSSSGIHGFV